MKVTVYIPTKDRKDSLSKAVDSVLNQTYKDIELIVVSDGSTDDTESYLKQKASTDARVHYFIKTKSEGAPAARNLAIRNATGDFITGLDDDDQFLPNRIELFVDYWRFLSAHSIVPSCIYSPHLIYRDGKEIGKTQNLGAVNHEQLFEANQIGNQIFAPKSVYIEAGMFDEGMPAWQDMEFFYRVLKMFGTASLLDIPSQIVDDTPRKDRISVKASNRLREANRQFALKHCKDSGRHFQMLYLQMFSSFYGMRPKISDWIIFLKHGFWIRGVWALLLATFRN